MSATNFTNTNRRRVLQQPVDDEPLFSLPINQPSVVEQPIPLPRVSQQSVVKDSLVTVVQQPVRNVTPVYQQPAVEAKASVQQSATREKAVSQQPIVDVKPAIQQPSGEAKPVVQQPVVEAKPVIQQPVAKEPSIVQQSVGKGTSIPQQRVAEKTPFSYPWGFTRPSYQPPVVKERPIVQQPIINAERVIQQPIVDVKPLIQQPVVDVKPVIQQPVIKPVIQQPVVKPVIQQPFVDVKPVIQQPVVDVKPVIQQPVIKPVIQQPVVKPVIQQPVVDGKPVTQQPIVDVKPVIQQPTVNVKTVIQQPVAKAEPVVQQPVAPVKPVSQQPVPQEKPLFSWEQAIAKPIYEQSVAKENLGTQQPSTKGSTVFQQTVENDKLVRQQSVEKENVVRQQPVAQAKPAFGRQQPVAREISIFQQSTRKEAPVHQQSTAKEKPLFQQSVAREKTGVQQSVGGAVIRKASDRYRGTQKKLVLAFDIGTTNSAISYSILDPGHFPETGRVNGFRGQSNAGDSKIPTIILYDKAGKARFFGAEACQEDIEDQAKKEEWVKAQWFKLHMCPQSIRTSDMPHELYKLPPGKTVVDLFADFMKYLHECAKTYIQDTRPTGKSLWGSVEATVEYVLTHPNGWEGPQQQQMRQAAIKAGLVPDTATGHERIRFVTEGEASLLYCIQNGLTEESAKNGDGILIVDAGGGTVDISAYGESLGGKFEEISVADCYMQGAAYVTSRAHEFFNDFLRGSTFSTNVEDITNEFDRKAKLRFEKPANPVFIKFGGPRDTESAFNIASGQLKLEGTKVASFFHKSIDCMLQAIKEQRQKAAKKITAIFMVGGFSASNYLFAQIKEAPELAGIAVRRPETQLNKPVADGAISFYLDGYVKARVSKMAYGVLSIEEFDESIPSHRERQSRAYTDIDGKRKLPNFFGVIIPKGEKVTETEEYRRSFFRLQPQTSALNVVTTKIIAYRGPSANPEWMDVEKDKYTPLCQIKADTTELCKSLTPTQHQGRSVYKIEYDIIMPFGQTELKAQIAWNENGIEKRGPAEVVYHA